MYPTKKAREAADEVVESLPLSATMLEHIVKWEETYLEHGGKVNP